MIAGQKCSGEQIIVFGAGDPGKSMKNSIDFVALRRIAFRLQNHDNPILAEKATRSLKFLAGIMSERRWSRVIRCASRGLYGEHNLLKPNPVLPLFSRVS